jgi:hypothetical protein
LSPDDTFFTQSGISYTMAGWFRPGASGGDFYIFGLKGWNNAVRVTSNVVSVEMASRATSIGTLTDNSIPPSFTLTVGKWYFIAASVDTVGLTMRLYVDGKLISTSALTGSYIPGYTQFSLGNFLSGQFYGNIDKVGLYKKALGLAEIQSIYLAQKDSFFTKK